MKRQPQAWTERELDLLKYLVRDCYCSADQVANVMALADISYRAATDYSGKAIRMGLKFNALSKGPVVKRERVTHV